MPSVSEFPARGKVLRVENGTVVFVPANTTYELRLACAQDAQTPVERTLSCLIRADARKIWTVPSGGNFVVPIFGPPKIIQGRIRYLDEKQMVVQGGVPIVVNLPEDPRAYDLVNGPLSLGALVNATLLPGATFEPASEAAGQ